MPTTPSFAELTGCPRCDKAPLEADGDGYRCGGCKTVWPAVGGIPWLFAEPDASLGEWRNRLHFELRRLAHEVGRLEAALSSAGLPETKRRLELQLAATTGHRKALQVLLQALGLESRQAGYESHLALRTRLPRDQGLNTYYANLHRDWCWGDAESEASLGQIRRALAADEHRGEQIGDTLVLGAGAGRLAYDIHMRLGASRTVALDFNPLLLLVARQVMSGEELALHEFPIAPKSTEDVAPLRMLRAPEQVRDGFFLVLADALRPPFHRGAFDTVVTPWLIDIVTEDFATFAQRINRLLRPGGRWVSFGSLAFERAERELRHGPEEVTAIVTHSGFATPYAADETIPYMCSPASRHARRETVFTFSAVKTGEIKAPPRHKALPDWLVTGKKPVPLAPSFRTQALTTQIYAHVMSLIDGRRSIDDMAVILEKQKLMTRDEALPAIRNFLTRMLDDSRSKPEF
jgi:SAM-dependent methyltransferase